MARKALKVKCRKKKEKVLKAKKNGSKPKFSTKVYNRCLRCGRNGSYMRKFGTCRICFRLLARAGRIPGVKKSSW